MPLNVKSPEAHRLAAELASLKGQTITQVVTDALRLSLDQEKRSSRREGLAEELLAIGRQCSAHLTGPASSADVARILYDDEGMPR